MDSVDEKVRIERHVAGNVDERQVMSPGVLGEQAVLELGQAFEIAIAEGEELEAVSACARARIFNSNR